MLIARSNVAKAMNQNQPGITADGDDPIDAMGARLHVSRGSEIYADEDPAEFVYKIVSGAVRVVKLLSDGRRQISSFHFAGDTFGLEAGDSHSFSAEAIADTVVAVVKRTALMALAERDAEFARRLWEKAARDLASAQQHMLLLGRKSALERIATFLVDMAKRHGTGDAADLPMSRQDMADYLGLTVETVSRTLTQLEEEGVIQAHHSRHIVFNNPGRLGGLHA